MRLSKATAFAALFCALLLFSVSAHAVTMSVPVDLNTSGSVDGADYSPQLATDGAGVWIVVWQAAGGTFDVHFSRSTDDGRSWTTPAILSAGVGSIQSPAIASDGAGKWVAAWTAANAFGADNDILVSRSANDGGSWTSPVPLNSNAVGDTEGDGLASLACDGAGNCVAAWVGHATGLGADDDILVSHSANSGATWTAVAPLDPAFASDASADFWPHIATNRSGDWLVTYSTGPADAEIAASHSNDNGASWTVPVIVNSNAAGDTAQDSRPRVATDGSGAWVTIWSATSGATLDLLASTSTNNGSTWTPLTTVRSKPDFNLGVYLRASLATDGAGAWVAMWSSDDDLGGTTSDDSDDVLTSTSSDNGATWTAVTAASSKAYGRHAGEQDPDIATDSAGNWVVVSQGVGTDSDFDVFASHSVTAAGCPATVFCSPAGAGVLSLSQPPGNPSKTKLSWKWSKGAPVSAAAIADPTTTSSYSFCMSDDFGPLIGLPVPAATFWTPLNSGYRYDDRFGTNMGVRRVDVLHSTTTKSKGSMYAGGINLPIVPLPFIGEAVIELHNLQTGFCYGAVYGTGAISVNDAGTGKVKAKVK